MDDEKLNEMQFDKGWWDFILSDEPVSYEKKESVPNVATNDEDGLWDYVEDIFQNDIVIEVSVYGVNKGGLLANTDKVKRIYSDFTHSV